MPYSSIGVDCQTVKTNLNLFFFREKRLAKKYYDKLFKEYCISDLSRYKENKVNKSYNNYKDY